MTKDEEAAIRAKVNYLRAEIQTIEAPIEAERKARYAAEEAERFRLAKEAHERKFGNLVGKVVTSVDIKLSDEDTVVIAFHDGSSLSLAYDGGYYAGDGHVDVEIR